ncbi:unnamed protein product [Haemonchus placei]|uniref:DUF3668 domain-containing protein n=1 Tax=Haemonchus placei TaxID=6290 RepID=A0A0N4WTT5_HAEPC|nr:unnamed protein product [Haemonchus placei]
MAEQVFRSIAAEAKQIPTWDIESILTRAVYRALSDGGNQLVNVEYSKYPASIDKSRITTDAQLQLRLIAERLCTRVERRYEKRLLQQREKDRVDTDRKLADIRAEYAEQMEMRRRELERHKARLEEQFAEKDRALRHKIELQLAEKENILEITRKSLEIRLAELAMNKEHLDRAKAEFQAKFASDVELLNKEWAKLSGKQEELKEFYRQEFETEQLGLVEKSAELEKVNAALKKKLSDSSTEIYQLRSQLTKMTSLEEDLKTANDRLHKEMGERHRLSRCSYEVERLRDENAYLKEELDELKSTVREIRGKSSVVPVANKSNEEALVVKINELKNIIRVMNDKIASLTSERDYLRKMLRDTRKEVASDSMIRFRDAVTAGGSKNSRLLHRLRDTDSSEDTSVSSSSADVGSSSLQNLKKRFNTLEELAKTLNTTIDCVAAARSTHSQVPISPDLFVVRVELYISEGYDDFCRSLKQNLDNHSSPKKAMEKEARGNEAISSRGPINISQSESYTDKRDDGMGPSSSSIQKPVSFFPTRETRSTQGLASEGNPSQPNTSTEAAAVPSNGIGSFAERLKARNEAKRTLVFQTPPEKVSLMIKLFNQRLRSFRSLRQQTNFEKISAIEELPSDYDRNCFILFQNLEMGFRLAICFKKRVCKLINSVF